jgi:thiol-disulfide isomerase/thioredoxin
MSRPMLRVLALLLPVLAVLTFGGMASAQEAPTTAVSPAVSRALATAARQRLPVLVEFRAPWCYSCYYMARHVHTGIEWNELKRRAVVVEVDADSPEGAEQMKAWGIKPLPSYVVLDPKGRELGRVLGERTRAAFYAHMERFLAPGARLDELRDVAAAGGRTGRDAAEAALMAFHSRGAAEDGLRWFYDLPGRVRRAYEPDEGLGYRLARLRLMEAAQNRQGPTCAAVAPKVFARAGCELPYELQLYEACVGEASPDALMREQRVPLEQLVEKRVFGDAASRCADERSPVLILGELYRKLGDSEARTKLLDLAIENLRARLADDLGRDRSAADNLRVYIEQAQRWNDYDRLMPRLIATWPHDYVYPYRFGKSLLERERASEALPYLERAAARAYGENRLRVAELRVKALKRLGRQDDARAVAAEALKANGPWFPDLARSLKAEL